MRLCCGVLLLAGGFLVGGLAGGFSASGKDPQPARGAEVTDSRGEPSLEVDEEEVERLQALGYVDVVPPGAGPGAQDAGAGVVHFLPERTQSGLNYHTIPFRCESRLSNLEGEVLRSWRHEPCWKWPHSVLLPDGGVLALHNSPDGMKRRKSSAWVRWLLRFDAAGGLLWSRRMPVHHDVDLLSDGRIAVLSYAHRLLPEFHPSAEIRDDYIEILDSEGAALEKQSLTELLQSAPEPFTFRTVKPRRKDKEREVDLLHTNSLEWMRDPLLAARNPLYALDNVLVCMRHQNAVAILDWKRRQLLWSWGQGDLSGPHDATLLSSGNILIFDNGLGRGWSRVLELDPLEGKVVWEYRAQPEQSFYTDQRGAAQRLHNGNTLVTNSQNGQVFEVTREGEVVWDYRNSERGPNGFRLVIARMRRVVEARGDARFQRSD